MLTQGIAYPHLDLHQYDMYIVCCSSRRTFLCTKNTRYQNSSLSRRNFFYLQKSIPDMKKIVKAIQETSERNSLYRKAKLTHQLLYAVPGFFCCIGYFPVLFLKKLSFLSQIDIQRGMFVLLYSQAEEAVVFLHLQGGRYGCAQ